MLFEEFVEQHRVHCIVAHGVQGIRTPRVRAYARTFASTGCLGVGGPAAQDPWLTSYHCLHVGNVSSRAYLFIKSICESLHSFAEDACLRSAADVILPDSVIPDPSVANVVGLLVNKTPTAAAFLFEAPDKVIKGPAHYTRVTLIACFPNAVVTDLYAV